MTERAKGHDELLAEVERLKTENKEALAKLVDHEAEIELLTYELRDTQHLLEQSRDRYADLYDFAPVGYVTLTRNGIIMESNATFAAMMGVDQRGLQNIPFNVFLASSHELNLFLSHLDKCRKEGGKINTDLRLKHRNGEVLEIELSSVPSADFITRTIVYRTAVLDLTERRRAEVARDETARQLQLIMDSAPVPIGYLDKDERFVFVNAEYLRKFELDQQDVLGNSFREVHGSDMNGLIADIDKGIAGEASMLESEVISRSGNKYFLRINIAPDCTTGDAPCGIVVIATDLTDQMRHLQELSEAKESAEKANRAKTQFLANMSHELRTPLNGVLGMLQLLLNGYAEPLQEKQQEMTTKALKSTKILLSIINDILDLSKIEAGRLDIERKPFSIKECVADAIELFSIEAQQKGLEIGFSVGEDVPKATLGDNVRLRQVLLNLIGNALKFTMKGRIAVRVEAGAKKPDGKKDLIFTVTDTGIGIPAQKKDLLFRPFGQLDESDTRRYGGTGLGLAISRRIIDIMGGTITVESEPGVGSSFSFNVPMQEVEEAKLAVSEAPPSGAIVAPVAEEEQKLRILVAEDDPMSSALLRSILERQGFQMELAQTGREAVEMWERGVFDLIIMDVQMPKLDGIAATRIIREKERATGKHVPILAITAHAYQEEGERCRAAGMDAFLPKPLDLRKGVQLIRSLAAKTSA